MKKSVAIFGKGPSILSGDVETYKDFDEISFINWPIYDDRYLPNRCDSMFTHYYGDYEFFNNRKNIEASTPVWSDTQIEKFGIKSIYSTVKANEEYYNKYVPKYMNNIPIINIPKYHNIENSEMDVNSGVMALEYYSDRDDIDTIFFIGFDSYGEKNIQNNYYFDFIPTANQEKDMNNWHSPSMTINYLQTIGERYSNINYFYTSNLDLKEYSNFKKMI
jgi:hypothetical protein